MVTVSDASVVLLYLPSSAGLCLSATVKASAQPGGLECSFVRFLEGRSLRQFTTAKEEEKDEELFKPQWWAVGFAEFGSVKVDALCNRKGLKECGRASHLPCNESSSHASDGTLM